MRPSPVRGGRRDSNYPAVESEPSRPGHSSATRGWVAIKAYPVLLNLPPTGDRPFMLMEKFIAGVIFYQKMAYNAASTLRSDQFIHNMPRLIREAGSFAAIAVSPLANRPDFCRRFLRRRDCKLSEMLKDFRP
jgi:hypothetical protein